MTDEIWKDIPGYEGRYMVSSHGRVRSVGRDIPVLGGRVVRRFPDALMAQMTDFNEYKAVFLRRPGEHKRALVHRLVAIAFIPNPEAKPIVNHKDRNRTNNHVSNLEWSSESENARHWMAMDNKLRSAQPSQHF